MPRRDLLVRNSFSPSNEKLIQTGYVDPARLREAIYESRRKGRSLLAILEKMTGKPLPPHLLRHIKRQQLFELKILYGLESLDPELTAVDTQAIEQLIRTLIPLEFCRRYQLLPLSLNEAEYPPLIRIGMVNPDHLSAIDELGYLLRANGINFQRVVIDLDTYQLLISKFLDVQIQRKAILETKLPVELELEADLDRLGGIEDLSTENAEINLDEALLDENAAPIISLVNKILAKALQNKASDIHIEPQEDNLRIRYRKDGLLHYAFEPLPRRLGPALISRVKIIANLDIAERRCPQDGRILRLFQGRKVDFRVSTLPSRYGEKVVLRILDNSSMQLGLNYLISDPLSLETVREMVSRPFGLVLVTGPTGSGKTTTLYSALAECNKPEVNISTVEDPIEYTLPGITQVQVIREKGMNFASILRAFLRQDPDVILVGETRDKETAKTAIEAALTGHLVLTTLHTNDAASAVVRLAEMDVEPFMVSASLLGVVAQRLVRRLCPTCRIPYHPTPEKLAQFGLLASTSTGVTFYRANTIISENIFATANTEEACPTCAGIGYAGRCGVYEVMRVSEHIKSLITEGAPPEHIKEVAVDEGMQTLLSYSLALVERGETTLEEVERVTFSDNGLKAELKAKRKTTLNCQVCSAGLLPEWLDCPYCLTPRFVEYPTITN
jgi:type IV pilus assembly protein PilB